MSKAVSNMDILFIKAVYFWYNGAITVAKIYVTWLNLPPPPLWSGSARQYTVL